MSINQLRILHVDDEQNERELTEIFLRQHMPGVEVISQQSVDSALNILKDERVDCILSDYQMPGLNGMEFLQRLRERDDSTPFIFLTGQGNENIAASALRNGADDYFSKNESIAHYERLVNSIRRVIRSHREMEERQLIEAELKQYGMLFNATFNEIYVVDEKSNTFIRANKTAIRNIQYNADELLSMTPRDLIADEDLPLMAKRIDAFNSGLENSIKFNCRYRRKDGSTYPVAGRVQRMFFDNREVSVGVIEDLSKQQDAEQRLNEATIELTEANSALSAVLKLSKVISERNRNTTTIFQGATKVLLEGLQPEGALSVVVEMDGERYQFGESPESSYVQERSISAYKRPIGCLTCYFSSHIAHTKESVELLMTIFSERLGCIYERLEIEGRLKADISSERDSTEAMLSLLNETRSIILMIDPESGAIHWANSAAVEFYGYPREELVSMNIREINQLDSYAVKAEIERARCNRRNYFVFPHKCSDGSVHTMQVYSSPVTYLGRKMLFSIIHDFKDSEQIMDSLENQLRSMSTH